MVVQIRDKDVAEVFNGYPADIKRQFKEIRKLILKVGRAIPEMGGVVETLKWEQPSYLPKKKNIGTTVRIHWLKSQPNQFGVYVNCNTSLIAQFRRRFPGTFQFEGKRGIIFQRDDEIPTQELGRCIEMAFTYFLKK